MRSVQPYTLTNTADLRQFVRFKILADGTEQASWRIPRRSSVQVLELGQSDPIYSRIEASGAITAALVFHRCIVATPVMNTLRWGIQFTT
jgi:hypothetical protein